MSETFNLQVKQKLYTVIFMTSQSCLSKPALTPKCPASIKTDLKNNKITDPCGHQIDLKLAFSPKNNRIHKNNTSCHWKCDQG
jgi:hypothetical protein